MTNIVLIHPRLFRSECHFCPLPLNLLSISSILDKEGYKIKIIDQRINSDWKRELIKELKNEPTCVGITSMVGAQILGGLTTSKIVKENSDAPVVWGGPFPTMLPQLTIENENVDVVCEGEGEITFYELVKTLEKSKPLSEVKGIWYKENEKIRRNEKRPFLDLNNLPDLPYHLINLKDYKREFGSWITKEFMISVLTSRGCPYQCTYCFNQIVNQCRWRALRSERVIELLKNLVDKYHVKYFRFNDDNFFVSQKRANEIMRGILREKMDIKMEFQGTRVDTICRMKKNELNVLYDAGCRSFSIGLETGSPRILKLIKKGTTIEQAYAANKRLSRYPEIRSQYNFMAGFPTETINDLSMTVNMMSKLYKENPNIKIPILFLFTPWPGTDIYNLTIQHGFAPPKSLMGWGYMDWNDEIPRNIVARPWLSNEFKKMFSNVTMINYLADSIDIELHSNIFKILAKLYLPFAKFRFNHNFYNFVPEGVLIGLIWKISQSGY